MSAHPLHRWWDRRKSQRLAQSATAALTDEWFPEERAFFDDPAQLTAALCGRRAGKTRGVIRDHLRDLLTIPGYRGMYINTTRGECEQLAWVGNRADGFRPLVESMKLPLKLDNGDLTIHNPATDGWMYLRGADDEAELRKRLGGAYHKVTWDEWQKIPSKLGKSLREVFFPTLLDFGGKFRGTGTPARNMVGIAWDVTRPDREKREKGWSVHEWNLLKNPYWGRAEERKGQWFVVARDGIAKVNVSGPHAEGELPAAIYGARWTYGIKALAALYGGAETDAPIMQREGFGIWTHEDSNYVYHVHKVKSADLLYAPQRLRPDGFPDIRAALKDLPFDYKQAFFGLGVDIGFTIDPFAFFLGCWHPHDPALYEVASWGKLGLDSDDQAKVIADIREIVGIGYVSADVGGPVTPMGKGWSKQFMERYQMPILEAEKNAKYENITLFNTDIGRGRLKLREGGLAYENMSQLQWSRLVSGSGRMIEDPTMPNDGADAALYMARQARHYGWSPADVVLPSGSREKYNREAQELEEDLLS